LSAFDPPVIPGGPKIALPPLHGIPVISSTVAVAGNANATKVMADITAIDIALLMLLLRSTVGGQPDRLTNRRAYTNDHSQ
jgi:hypothetical protein